jgi:hypothetical protein
MTPETEKELFALAGKRVSEALNSVIQLMEDQDQNMKLQAFIIAALVRAYGDQLRLGAKMKDGKPPSPEMGYLKAIMLVTSALDIGCEIVNQDEAEAVLQRRNKERS